MHNYSIRPLKSDDAILIASYFHTLSEVTKAVFPGAPFSEEEAQRIAMQETDHPEIRRYLVLASDEDDGPGPMAGTIWFWQWDRMVPWIGISIADSHQGKGVGKMMMKHAINQALKESKGGILLTTHKENVRGHALYRRFGFETIGQDGRGEDLMILNFKV